jgi:putative flippase GtrA
MVRMRSARRLANHPLAGSGLRYVTAGATVAAVYLGLPVVLNGGAGVPIQAAILIALILAASLHFTLQRYFVFRHVAVFALSRRQQVARYVVIWAGQYGVTAAATAILPKLLGLSSRATFVVVTLVISATFFIVLRTRIFHAPERGDDPPESRSAHDVHVGDEQLTLGGGSAGESEPNPVQPQVHIERQPGVRADERDLDRLVARRADVDGHR